MNNIIYLDNNATTPLAPEVLEEMLPVLAKNFGNPASKTHAYGWYAEELVKLARERLAKLISADTEEVIFTSCATESINLAIKGLATKQKTKGSIISAQTEHRASLDTLEYLKKLGFQIIYLKTNEKGEISISELEKQLNDSVFLVSLMFANNEIGTIHQIKEFVKLTHKAGALFHCDATQALAKEEIDVKSLDVDLLSISGHKIYGPKGVGALYIKNCSPKIKLEPLIHGGGHENDLRSGTLNVPAIVGFGKACEIAGKNLTPDREKIFNLSKLFLKTLKENLPDVSLNGPELENRLLGNLNLRFPGIDNAKLLAKTNAKLAYSLSSACTSAKAKASHVLSAIGLSKDEQKESIRIGIGKFNTEEEIKEAADILIAAVKELGSR